ncbi:MAG: hypothetical protein IJL20_10700 [Lachnospiraceae bacterium]|nr:hypothetical protein [Lachnospiraceae bacterium]
MKHAKLKVIMLLYLIVVTVCAFILALLQRSISMNIGVLLLIIFIAAIPVAVGIFKIMIALEMKKPYAKLHKEFMDEIWTNGYTDKVRELGEQALAADDAGEKIEFTYLKEFCFYLSDYYNLMKQHDRVFSVMRHVDGQELVSRSVKFMDGGMSVLTYFGVLMEAARGLNSKETAANIMSDAAPYLEKKYNMDVLSMMADVTYYNYYVTMGGYDEAKKYADKLMSYKSLGVEKFSSKYYAAAEIVMLTEGDKEKARAILDQGWSMSDRDKAVVRQAFDEFYRRLGLQ